MADDVIYVQPLSPILNLEVLRVWNKLKRFEIFWKLRRFRRCSEFGRFLIFVRLGKFVRFLRLEILKKHIIFVKCGKNLYSW